MKTKINLLIVQNKTQCISYMNGSDWLVQWLLNPKSPSLYIIYISLNFTKLRFQFRINEEE